MTIIARLIINTVAILLIAYLLPGLIRVEGLGSAILAAFLLGFVNAILRPILVLLTLPLTILTFGLFLLVINGLMLGLVAFLVPGVYVNGFGGAILASLLFSLVSWILSSLLVP